MIYQYSPLTNNLYKVKQHSIKCFAPRSYKKRQNTNRFTTSGIEITLDAHIAGSLQRVDVAHFTTYIQLLSTYNTQYDTAPPNEDQAPKLVNLYHKLPTAL